MLTKSNYLLGLQCPKLLWVTKNEKKRIPEPDVSAKHNFEVGTLIGELATEVFENGIDLSKFNFKENIDKTKEALEERKPIFEAGFLINDLFSRGDVLLPVGENEWDIIEVKSATKVKDINIHDVSFQKYVYELYGIKIRNSYLMHIDNTYKRNGDIDPKKLFYQEDITGKVEDFSIGIKERIENMLKIISSKEEPKVSIGVHCTDPYDCSLKLECWKDVPEESVFELYRMLKKKTFGLYNSGITKMKDVPEDVKLNDKQQIQRRLANDGEKHINKLGVENFLNNLKYPIYYLDFETINPAIPKFDEMKPYQRIPFQFSLHIQKEPNGELKHISFLSKGTSDPRQNFMQSLKDNLGETGDIVVYNQGFEKGVLREGAEALPEFSEWLEGINPRIKDLLDVFRNFDYYDSRQKGSASIKAVLPVLSELKYDDLDIKNGILASLEYERVTYGDSDEEDRKKVMNALEKYCELDTLAEVEIINGLRKELKN